MDNSKRIILDLCGGTGSWSAPYKKAGYDVRVITLPYYDVLTYIPPVDVFGVLAAPPCTDFSIAGSQHWKSKDLQGDTTKSLEVVNACLKIIEKSNPLFWALENPIGRLKKFIGKPYCKLNYLQFGCAYSKSILLWGKFVIPMGKYYNPRSLSSFDRLTSNNYLLALPEGYDWKGARMDKRASQRSITYYGFADAFYLQNSALNPLFLAREKERNNKQKAS